MSRNLKNLTRKYMSHFVQKLLGGLSIASLMVVGLSSNPAMAQTIYASNLRGQYDIFSGKNNKGPYVLSWNQVVVDRDNPVEVVIDSRTLKPEEFNVDKGKGILNFTASVTDKNVVRIHYSYDPQKSRRNAGIASSPITLPLANLGVTEVSVIALPNNGSARTAAETPLVFNLGSSRKLLGGNFSTKFNFAGANSYGQQTDYSFGNDRNGFNASYYKTAKHFASTVGKGVGMGDAASRLALGARLAPAKWLGMNYSFSDTEDVVSKADRKQQVYAIRAGGVQGGPLLNYLRTEDDITDANKRTTEVNTDKLDLSARLTKTTNITASGVQTITDAPTSKGDTTVRDATVTVASASAKGSSGTLTLNVGGKESYTSQEAKQNVAIRLQPVPAISVTAEKNEGKVTTSAADGLKASETTVVTEKQNLSVRVSPAPVFSVAAEQNEGKVTTVKGDGKKTSESTVVTQKATAELLPLPLTKVTTSLTSVSVNDVKVSSTAFDASIGQGKRIEIATGMTNRSTEISGASALDTTRARFALRPMNNFTVTGGVIWNPEENNVVRQAVKQEVGVQTRLGALELGTAYAMTVLNGSASAIGDSAPQYGEVNVNVGLRLDKTLRLDGNYKDSLRYSGANSSAQAPRYLRVYGLGLSRNVGPNFNWSLMGQVSDDRNRPINLNTDYKAEAKMGVKF